ncbi:UNVERIFIED_CONTAM: hypothetical protein RMT77_002851 [Armadillidium vulgare]
MNKVLAVVFHLWSIVTVLGSESFLGGCPEVQPMEDLKMEELEGIWYVVESLGGGAPCMTWELTMQNDTGTWQIIEKIRPGWVVSLAYGNEFTTTGTLTPLDLPGIFSVKWSNNVLGSYDLTIYHTDYENALGVFACQELLFGHRQHAFVLSKEPTLSLRYKQMTRGKLAKFGIHMYYFRKVDQFNCNHGLNVTGGIPISYGPIAIGPLG